MIIETITVTTTATSISALLTAAGRTDHATHPKAQSIAFRMDESSSEKVYISDANTVAAVTLLDPANGQPYAAHMQYSVEDTLLSASASVSVGIVVSF